MPPRLPHEPSRMRMHGPVSLDEVLASLVGYSPRISSVMGPQLEVLQARALNRKEDPDYRRTAKEPFGRVGPAQDPWRAFDQMEQAIGRDVGVLRCLDDLCQVKHVSTRWVSGLVALHKRVGGAQGSLAVACLRAYHEWALKSKERALAAVWALSERIAGREANAEEVAGLFRIGQSARARGQAARLYSDAFEVLAEWVRIWNKKQGLTAPAAPRRC